MINSRDSGPAELSEEKKREITLKEMKKRNELLNNLRQSKYILKNDYTNEYEGNYCIKAKKFCVSCNPMGQCVLTAPCFYSQTYTITDRTINKNVIPKPNLNRGKTMEPLKKPPLGLIPRKIKDQQRLEEILEALDRYIYAKKAIPINWIEEYNELCEKLDKEISKIEDL